MINLSDTQTQVYATKSKPSPPAIHISALPTRQNPQVDLPSFSIPLQYNLGSFKKIGEDVHLDLETTDQTNWDGRMIPNFNLMNLKPLIETRENVDMELKYEVKNESRVNFNEIQAVQAIETEDILGKETVNEGQTISPDFEIQRYQNYQNENEKRFREHSFEDSIMEDGRNDFVCDSDFLCKNSFEKVDEKRSEFEDCHLLDSDNAVGISNFESNL